MSDEVENGLLIRHFQREIRGTNVNQIAQLVRRLLTDRAWERFVFPNMVKTQQNSSLGQFLTTEPLQGCGFKDLGAIDALIKKACDAALYADWRDAMTTPIGTNQHTMPEGNDNVMTHIKAEQGNSLSYTLSRLKRERPDLFAKLEAGEIRSANAAAIQAGFRKPPPTAFEKVKQLWPSLSAKQKAEIRALP